MDESSIKNYIKKRKALIESFLAEEEPSFIKKNAVLVDEYLFSMFEKSISARDMTVSGNPFAVIALGGYGRKEHCIHSDIDLLILFEHKVPAAVEAFIQELLYPLWDNGFEVGYAVRDIKECLEMAFDRFDILTTVLDARFICGASLIYTNFMEMFRHELSEKHFSSTLNWLYENGEKRHFDYGDSTYRIVPDLKSGFGGLRDYHTLLWYAKIKSNIKEKRDLEYYAYLSHYEYANLEKSLNFIWKVRNHLHHIIKRKCDTLYFEYQTELASLMGYGSGDSQQAVETFLGNLHAQMDFLKQINQITFEDIFRSRRTRKEQTEVIPTKTEGLIIKRNRVYFRNTVSVLQHPILLLKIFLESGRRKIPLSITSRRIVKEFAHMADENFVRDPEAVKIFKALLSLSFWEFNVLNVMATTGILEKFIPEFNLIGNKIQYNHYHTFPVDKHSIRCVQVMNSFRKKSGSSVENLYNFLFREVRDKNVLLFAALLHDIGKSTPEKEHSKTGAKIAGPILERLRFNRAQIDDVKFLIENHLFLIKTATRRDINDEETALFAANRIKKIRLLRMLYLLTVADSKATGPKAWNQWTENLLRDLFLKTMGILKKADLASGKTRKLIEKKKDTVLRLRQDQYPELSSHDREEFLALLDSMSPRYLLNIPAQEVLRHIKLFKKIGDREFAWEISQDRHSEIRTVSICGRDKPGFYSKIAGVFFLSGLDIVSSQAYSFGKEYVLDIFKVKPPADKVFEHEKWLKAEDKLMLALKDDRFLDTALKRIPDKITISSGKRPRPNSIKIDNKTSSFFTIVEVFTYDFPGLLFAVTNALYRAEVNVNVAMISTKVDQVVDVFYIKGIHNDSKLETEDELENLKKMILESLPEIYAKEVIKNEKSGSYHQAV